MSRWAGRERAGLGYRARAGLGAGLAVALVAGAALALQPRPSPPVCVRAARSAAPAPVTAAGKAVPPPAGAVEVVTTTAGEAQGLVRHPDLRWAPDRPAAADQVPVDDAVRFQQVRGVGAALTESSAAVVDALPAAGRARLLTALFDASGGAGLTLLRLAVGASDFALSDYTLADTRSPDQQGLAHFGVQRDEQRVLPLVREARAVQPALAVVATAWSPPAWMKTSGTTHGGSLRPDEENAYATYLTCAVAAYRAHGAPVVAITPVNEPERSTPDYPSTAMPAAQEAEFVGVHLRPSLTAAGLSDVGVIGYDHNWDDVAYPSALLTSRYAGSFAGVAFHCYAGDPSAQSRVTGLTAEQQVWTTECSGGSFGSPATDLVRDAHDMVIGAFRNGSVASLFWNIALDPAHGPGNGGCQDCRGVVTVDPASGAVTYNPEYWVLAHVGRFVGPGAVRVATPAAPPGGIASVAFRNPDGTHALVLLNPAAARTATVRWSGRSAAVPLPAASLTTLLWA